MRAKYVRVEVATANGVAERWKSNYFDRNGGSWMNTAGGNSKDIYDALCALGVNPPIDKVAKAIGNKSWSYITCDGCNESVDRAVSLGEEYSEPKRYCSKCIAEAAEVIKPPGETE